MAVTTRLEKDKKILRVNLVHAMHHTNILNGLNGKIEQMVVLGAGVITMIMEPTEWIYPLVVVQKLHGGLRICVDLTKLNTLVRRSYTIVS